MKTSDQKVAREKDRKSNRLPANAGWMAVILALICILAWTASRVGAAAGRVPPGTVRASRFELVDISGKTQAVLELTEEGPALTFFQRATDKPTFQLRGDTDGTYLNLMAGAGGGGRLTFASRGPLLSLHDGRGNPMVSVGMPPQRGQARSPSLKLYDSNGKVAWLAP